MLLFHRNVRRGRPCICSIIVKVLKWPSGICLRSRLATAKPSGAGFFCQMLTVSNHVYCFHV
jgi:hypothetical protein